MPFNDKLEWKPTPKQARFLSVPFSVKEAMYGGGAGSGKSELLLMLPLVYEFHKHPHYKQLFLRRTYKQLNKEIVPRSQDIYPKFGAKWNGSDSVWTFPRPDQFGSGAPPSGARVFLGHCENENDVHNYDSMEINVFSPDEVASLTEYIYLYIGLTRVRTSHKDLPAIIRAAGMPGDVGHGFIKKRFVDPFPAGGKIIVGKAGVKRVYIHSTQADNPHIDQGYKQSLEALPEAEKQAKLYGSWDAYLGQVFEEFRDKKYPDEPPNALHVIEPFDIPSWWPKILAIDWGYNAMCSVGWAAISPNKRVYVYRHQYFYKEKIEEWAPKVRYWVDKDKPVDIIICHSAEQHRGDPHSIIEQVSEALGTGVRLGEKNRIAGKLLVHEYLRWQKKPVPSGTELVYDEAIASRILRNKGLAAYKEYLKAFEPDDPEDNIPRLQFFKDPSGDIKLITDSVKACTYVKEAKDGKKKEDVAEFAGDDPYDMLRLLLHAADQFFGIANDTAAKLSKRAAVMKLLQETGDMTGFYRNMSKIDAEDHVGPVMMFHRGRRN